MGLWPLIYCQGSVITRHDVPHCCHPQRQRRPRHQRIFSHITQLSLVGLDSPRILATDPALVHCLYLSCQSTLPRYEVRRSKRRRCCWELVVNNVS